MDIKKIWSDWEVADYIGEGSFGKVYKIIREDFGHTYESALKVITIPASKGELASVLNDGFDEESATMYFRSMVEDIVDEFALMSKLRGNSNIVSYEDHAVVAHEGEIGWDIYIRMELLTPLFAHIKQYPLSVRDVILLGIHICQALEVCQNYNIIHRDIKPENIFVSDLGQYKLGDFGIARQLEKTSSGLSKKGTYGYMAPEVYKGEEYNATVDIYSLGIVLYRFLNHNRNPFLPPYPEPIRFSDKEQANTMRFSGKEMSPPCNAKGKLAEVILKACAFRPKDRYASAREMREALQDVLNTEKEADMVYSQGDALENDANSYAYSVNPPRQSESEIDILTMEESEKTRGLFGQRQEEKYALEKRMQEKARKQAEEAQWQTAEEASEQAQRQTAEEIRKQVQGQASEETRKQARADQRWAGKEAGRQAQRVTEETQRQAQEMQTAEASERAQETQWQRAEEIGKQAQGQAEAQRQSQAAQRQAEAQRQTEKAQDQAEKQRKAAEAKKQAQEQRKAQEAQKKAEKEQRKAQEAARKKAEQTAKQEQKRKEKEAAAKQKSDQTKKTPQKPLLIGGIAAALAIAILSVVLIQQNSRTTVPSFLDMDIAQAEAAALESHLLLETSGEAYSDTVKKGKIVSQDIEAGEAVQKESTVKVTVSKGKSLKVPNVLQSEGQTAKQTLSEAGFVVEMGEEVYSDEVAAGMVVSQTPKAGETVDEATVITLVLSKGAEQTEVPAVTGLSRQEAKDALTKANLKMTMEKIYSSEVEEGKVISQSIEKGTSVPVQTEVHLVISKGAEPVEEPEEPDPPKKTTTQSSNTQPSNPQPETPQPEAQPQPQPVTPTPAPAPSGNEESIDSWDLVN